MNLKNLIPKNLIVQKLSSYELLKFLVVSCLTLTLSLNWTPKSLAQLPFFTIPSNNQLTQSPPWDLSKAYTCGRFLCSNVYLDYFQGEKFLKISEPDLILTTLRDSSPSQIESKIKAGQKVEYRTNLVERIFLKITQDILNWKTISEVSYNYNWPFWLPKTVKLLHPWTPKIEVGLQNKQTVVFIPSQPKLGLASQPIVTVTENDARANGKTIQELAKLWQTRIRLAFSNLLWGHEFDERYPLLRFKISGVIMGSGLFLIFLISLIRNFLIKWKDKLRNKLSQLKESMSTHTDIDSLKSQQNNSSDSNNIFLRRQTLFQQQLNFGQLALRLLFVVEILIFALCITATVSVFPNTRFLSVYLLKQTIFVISLWILLFLLDELGDFSIDYTLGRWATQAQLNNPSSNRYTLRASTYSTTLKRITSFLTIFVGIYLTIWFLGVNPSVLAGAGVFAVGIAFLSRNLFEDLINGILILATDRYAIGDIIDLGGGMTGAVEDMNVFVTSLRNLDGQLIAIPNAKISSVINNTKNWSRVNFTIKIAWYEDIDQGISIMKEVSNQMQNEPEWCEKFLEPIDILGVDEVSHEGILIRALIKTQPAQQWAVAREFRRLLKKAFDEVGISLGIPYHQISVINSPKNSNISFVSDLSSESANENFDECK